MNAIKFEDLKVGDSKNPIEALLQQTGWSLEEALLRLADYKSSTSAKDSKNSDVKSEVKEEISEYYNLFMSVNKREDEDDSDIEIIDDCNQNDEKDDTIVTKSETLIEEYLTSKSTVIDTISVSDKNENNCEMLKSDTDDLKQINNTKVKNKLKIENLSIKHKKQSILKKYKCLRKQITKREIEKAEKKAAEVRKRLKLQLELLREKKKPNLKFLRSHPDSDAQNLFENQSLEHSNSVTDENFSKEESTDVLETGDTEFMIIDVIGGYQSPEREETNYDLEDYSHEKEIGLSENSFFQDQDQLSREAKSNSGTVNKATSKLKMCDYIKNLMDSEMEIPNSNETVCASNENQLSENHDFDKSKQNKPTSKLKICQNIIQSLEKFEKEVEIVQNSNKKASTSNENQLSEGCDSDKFNQNRATSKLKICENILQSLTKYDNEMKVLQNSSKKASTSTKNQLSENDDSDRLNIMQFNKTKTTENFLNNLSEFSKPVGNAIIPTKTKDITKIKGWKNKLFKESNEGKPAISKDNSFPKLQKENVLRHKSAFISEQLDRLLSKAPQLHQAASEIQDSESIISTTDNFTAPIASTSNITDASTSSNTSNIPTTVSTNIPSNSSTSTIPTLASVSSISSSNSTPALSSADVPSTSSPFDASLKPYKPKTLAEKRRLLEASRMPLNAELMYSMSRKQRQENQSRIKNYRSQLINNDVPFDRESYKISSDITNTYSYIVCNGRKLKVASSKCDEVLAYIKNRKRMSKVSYNQPRSETSQFVNARKPSLLKSLKEQPKVAEWDPTEWETVEMKLPKVFLSVVPQYGQVIHPKLEHLIRNETCFLSENRAKFALSLLRTKNIRSKLHTFKFPLSYENNVDTIKLKRKISVVDKTENKVTESDDEIQQGVKSVMDKLLNYVDVLDDTKNMHTSYEDVECSTDEPMLKVSTVGRPIKRQSGPRSKINKTALEMKRLNCQIVSVVNDEDNTDNEKCSKEVCKLGCICKTLVCDSKNLLPIHCGSWKCIFNCSCKNNNNMDKTSLPVGYNLLNAGVINRLQDQAKKNLAKVEKEFTQTIIKTNNQLIMVGDSKDRRRRVTKTPKKYNDFLNEDLSDTVESDNHQWSEDEVLPALSEDIKPCSVPLTKYNLNDIIPYCMIHSMYKCVCVSEPECGITDLHSVPSIPSVISRSPKALSPRKPEFPKPDAGKVHKRYREAPRPASFIKPRPKYVRKQKSNKTFNKEEFCSRTRGLSSPYYIPRNTTESYLDKTFKSTKRFYRDLQRYVRSLRVKLNELRRTSVLTDPILAKKEDIERQLVLETIDRLSPYLRGEAHLDKLISRQSQRLNGIFTPETMRRKHPCEGTSIVSTEISEDTPEEIFPSTNLNAITSCYIDSKTDSLDQAALSPRSDIQEKYMCSSKSSKREFRLLPWTSLQNNYNKSALEIWYLNTNKISPIIITQRNKRPSVNHCNIRIFEHLKDDSSIPLDFIRCIVHRTVPMNKHSDNIFAILAFNETSYSELYSICEKSSKKCNLKDKIRVSLLQQIKETSFSEDIDIESLPNEITEDVTEETKQDDELLQGDFQHCDIKNEKKLIHYFVRKFRPHTLYYDSGTPALFDSKRIVSLPLPREVMKCKWRLIYVDQIFSYLRLTLNNFTIKYSDLLKVVELARRKRKTVFLASESIRKGYTLKMFGLFGVPTYLDKIFVGPYLPDEGHHIDVLTTNMDNEMVKDLTNGLWVNQIENYQNCTDSSSLTESCIDLTEDEDLKSSLKNWKCYNLLKILGFSSSRKQNEVIECATGYEERTYWNDLNKLMKGIDFGKSSNKSDSEVIEKHYYSIKNKCTVRYFTTNIPSLGYIKAFLHEVTNVVDIMCPLTNQIKRFPNYGSAINGITRILIQNIFLIPLSSGLKIKMTAKLSPTVKTVLTSTILDGYHIAGTCGVKNIRHSCKEDLRKLGLTEYEAELVIEHRHKRQIHDLTNQLARSFSLESISNKRSYGDVLTEVIKKIIFIIKSTAGSSIKNIEKSFELINLYPTSVKTKIYEQLECVAFNLNKKELSMAELQKIRMSSQRGKSASPISPARYFSNAVTEMDGSQKIRLYPPTSNLLNLENQTEGSTSNAAIGESGSLQFQRIKLSKNGKLANCSPDVELKPILCKDMKFKDIRRSLPNEKFVISTAQKKPNLSASDVIITKLNRLHCFGTTVVSNKEKKIKSTIEDDVIIIEPEPTAVQNVKPTSLLRNQLDLKKRSSQLLEDNVVIQPEPKRLKTNVANDVTIQPELKNHIRPLGNGTIKSPSKNSVLQNNIVVAQSNSTSQKRLQVLLANGNTTSLLKGKYINLLPLKQDGKNKYVILPNKDSGSSLRKNIDVSKFKKVPGMQNGNQVLVSSQNGKSLLVPQSSNTIKFPVHRKPVKILPKEESCIKLPLNKTNTVSVPKAASLSNNIPANKKTNLSELKNLGINEDKSSSNFITIQNGETTQCFKVLSKNMITGQVVRPANCQSSNKLNSEKK